MRKVALLVLLGCATAHADKSPDTAKYLSGGGAAVAGGVMLFSFMDPPDTEPFNRPLMYTGLALGVVAPSLGELYAGEWFTPGMAVRIASAGVAVVAFQYEEETVRCTTASSSSQPLCTQLTGAGYAMVGLAAIGFIGGMWYDALDAGDAVDRWRSSHGIYVAPTVGPANGVSLGGYF